MANVPNPHPDVAVRDQPQQGSVFWQIIHKILCCLDWICQLVCPGNCKKRPRNTMEILLSLNTINLFISPDIFICQ